MLGTGTWHLKIGNMFYNGDITLRVFDDGGKYGFEIIEPKMTAPEVEIKRLSTVGNHPVSYTHLTLPTILRV